MTVGQTKQVRFYSRRELRESQRGWKEIMPTINRQIDARLQKIVGLACKEGCSHCCKLKVEALPHEVMEVVEYVRFSDRFTRDQRSGMLERLRSVAALTDGMDENEYRPFLGEDHRCMVYEVRPAACRAFGSTNVHICDLSEPDDGLSTFKAVPDSMLRLLATSGLFFAPFVKSCLDWWQGFGVEAAVDPGQLETIAQVQRLIEEGYIGREKPQ